MHMITVPTRRLPRRAAALIAAVVATVALGAASQMPARYGVAGGLIHANGIQGSGKITPDGIQGTGKILAHDGGAISPDGIQGSGK